jgi:predicted nuclease of predicted toxin-antitoxin system
MNLVADESVDNGIVSLLEKNSAVVYSIAKHHASIDDEQVLKIAVEKQALLLTEDKDFGELTIRFKKLNNGIILIRANELTVIQRYSILQNVLQKYGNELLKCFTVIDSEHKVRIRKLH